MWDIYWQKSIHAIRVYQNKTIYTLYRNKIFNNGIDSMLKIIPAGTRIYLTKKRSNHVLCIQPDTIILDDTLYVKYDVKVGGRVVIPKSTRVCGNWITESVPCIAAQLQVTKIYLQGSGQAINADSDTYERVSDYNSGEINDVGYMYRQNHYKSSSGIPRRIARYGNVHHPLVDNNRYSSYIEIDTREIPVTLLTDFTRYPSIVQPFIDRKIGTSANESKPPLITGAYMGPMNNAYGPGPINNPCDPCDCPPRQLGPYPNVNPCCACEDPPAACPPPTPPLGPVDPILNRGNFNQPRFNQRATIYHPPLPATDSYSPPCMPCGG